MSGILHEHIERIEPEEVYDLISQGSEKIGKDIAIIDVRDNDFVGGNIPNAHNFPSKQFQDQKEKIFDELKNYPTVIFHCVSSNGRGPRCANWYHEHLEEQNKKDGFKTDQKVLVLKGGFKAWQQRYHKDDTLVENFDEDKWNEADSK